MNYNEYIKGKRVAFVGACPNIKGLKSGKTINKYDVVIKTNGSILLKGDKYFEDYGSRCNVLYTNNQFYREMSPLPIEIFKQNGLKWLCMKACNNTYLNYYSERIKTRVIRKTMKEVNNKVNGALMGAYIFTDLLKCKPKELFITGIDFFASKKKVFEHDNYIEYIPGYLPEKIRDQGNEINAGKIEDGHNMLANTRYIYGLVKTHNITMPDFIYKLMIDIVEGRRLQV